MAFLRAQRFGRGSFGDRVEPGINPSHPFVMSALTHGHGTKVEMLLAWVLLLPIGITGLWAGVSHVFFAATAAAHIGWQVSPFQFEVGTADFVASARRNSSDIHGSTNSTIGDGSYRGAVAQSQGTCATMGR
jgi:hypothetical protein